jgi:putative sigma-54 modulation protein
MRLELTGRHVDITPTLRRLVDAKLAKLERALNDSAMSAHAVLTREKHRHRADITLHARGEKFLHGVGDSGSWEQSLSVAIDKITQQAHKIKGKWQERKRRGGGKGAAIAGEEGEAMIARPEPPAASPKRERARMPRILRTSRRPLKPMSLAEAAREIGTATEGVVVFRDVETSAISVLYRRNGELTLVETEA